MTFRFHLVACAMVATLGACSKSEAPQASVQSSASQASTSAIEVVDADIFFKGVPNYEGRKVYFYLDRVMATGNESAGKLLVDSLDTRSLSTYGMLALSDAARKKWSAMGLDSEREYTVTFGVRATDLTAGKKAMYDIVAEDFTVNYDSGAHNGPLAAPRKPGPNGLPQGEIRLPIPVTVADARQLELFPAQFKDKPVRITRRILKDKVTSHDDRYLLIDTVGTLKILVKKDIAEQSFATWPGVAALEVIGKVETNGGLTTVLGEEITVLE